METFNIQDDVAITDSDGAWIAGTVSRVMNSGTGKYRVNGIDGQTYTRIAGETLVPLADMPDDDQVPTDAEWTATDDATTAEVAAADAVLTGQRIDTVVNPDGSIDYYYASGRIIHRAAPDQRTHRGVTAAESFRVRGIQQVRDTDGGTAGRIARESGDVNGMFARNGGTYGTAGDIGPQLHRCAAVTCVHPDGRTTPESKFPTANGDPAHRLNVHRVCNTFRLSAANGCTRVATAMAH